MKAAVAFSLLAALATLTFTSASPLNLASRQSASVVACTQNADCKAAASYWTACQTATTLGLPQAPDSPERDCLCFAGDSTPSHPDWFAKLSSCIKCVDTAMGQQNIISNPLQALQVNFCNTGELNYTDFVAAGHKITSINGYPLEIPEAVLVSTQNTARTSTETCNEPTTSTKLAQTSTNVGVTTAIGHQACNYDNCLRQAIQSAGVVGSFCKTYTTTVQAATAGYPGFVSMCNNAPTSISSACTCLATIAQAPAPTQTSSHAATYGASPPPYVHTITDWVTTIIWVTPSAGKPTSSAPVQPPTTLHTSQSPSKKTSSVAPVSLSSLSAVTKSSSVLSAPLSSSSAAAKLSSVTPALSSSPSQTTKPSSVTPAPSPSSTQTTKSSSVAPASSSSSSAAAPVSSTWVTLPASDAMKACLASTDCQSAHSLYNQCSDAQANGNDTMSWNCFCQTNVNEWKSTLNACGACISKALPADPNGVPSAELVTVLIGVENAFCNVTDAGVKATSMSRLDAIGRGLTIAFESPIDFMSIILLEAPLAPSPPASTPAAPPSTKSNPASTLTSGSTRISTSSSVATTSSAKPSTPTWITLPASQAMLKCQSNACQPAAQIYNTCLQATSADGDQDSIFNCFCTSNKNQWQSTLSTCSTCIAAALPVNNPGATLQASGLVFQTEVVRQTFCNQTEAAMANNTLKILSRFGQILTSAFESPVEYFNMTLTSAPFAFPGRKRAVENMMPRGLFDAMHGLL